MATYTIPSRNFVDKRLPTIVSNYFVVPATGTGAFKVRVVEIPKSGVITPPSATDPIVIRQVDAVTHVHNPAVHKVFTLISTGEPTTTQALVDATTYDTGEIGFIFSGNTGITIEFIYQGQGSKWFASDANEMASGALLKDGSILSRHLNISSLTLSGNLTIAGAFRINGSQLLYLGKLAADPTPVSAYIGALYYHTTDRQFKGIAEAATPGTAKIVILG